MQHSCHCTAHTNSLPCRHLQHMDDAFTRSKWQACRRALQAEQDLVKNISKEIAGLEGPLAVAAPAQVLFCTLSDNLLQGSTRAHRPPASASASG